MLYYYWVNKMYTLEEKAIKFVIKAFENKKRIKEDINLSFHSISVGFMLKDLGWDAETVVSGFLHDIIEDTDYDYEYIKENFGENIANNVLKVSENKNIIDWKERKQVFIEILSHQEEYIILIELADKLHNLLSDYHLWVEKGNLGLATLKTTYEDNKWYYLEMKKIFNQNLSDNYLLKRYNEICNLYFK